MKSYYRIMLGRGNMYADEAYKGNFIGTGWFKDTNLTNKLLVNWRDFNKAMIPVYLEKYPDKTKVAAGLACGMLWTVSKGILVGDIVLCPNGKGAYFVGEVTTEYEYHKSETFSHRRSVRWFSKTIERLQMSQTLQNATGAIGTVSNITKYAEEIEALIAGDRPPSIVATDETIEDPATFALETHLEEFLVKNWHQTELGKHYDIYEVDGELVGQQYHCGTESVDIIDILAISKDKKVLLVVELKKGRASAVVVGQIQSYMGYVKEFLIEKGQIVKGVIIAHEDDIRIRRALAVTQNIEFYTYKVCFKLEKK